MNKVKTTFAAILAISIVLFCNGCDLSKYMPKSSFTTEKGPITKVYSAADGPYHFIAYVVDWKGTEVVVSDPLGKSSHKAGDTISFLAQKIEVSGTVRALSFTAL